MRRLTYKLGKFSPPTEVYKSYKPSNPNKQERPQLISLITLNISMLKTFARSKTKSQRMHDVDAAQLLLHCESLWLPLQDA